MTNGPFSTSVQKTDFQGLVWFEVPRLSYAYQYGLLVRDLLLKEGNYTGLLGGEGTT